MKNIKNIIFDFGVVLINLERDKFISNFKDLGVSEIENITSTAVPKGVVG